MQSSNNNNNNRENNNTPEKYNQIEGIEVRSPARICFFGEHQDYLGYPVIAAAINRYIFIKSRPIAEPRLNIKLLDLNQELNFPLFSQMKEELIYDSKRDYLRSCYNNVYRIYLKNKQAQKDGGNERIIKEPPPTKVLDLKGEGQGIGKGQRKGQEISIYGNIPINAGASSSSALVIAWLKYLLNYYGLKKNNREIAELGFRSEVLEFNEAGGMMDHFTSALGGLIYIEPAPKFKAISLYNYEKFFENSLILVNSQQKKNTVDDLKRVKMRALKSFEIIAKYYKDFDKYTTPFKDIKEFLDKNNEHGAIMSKDLEDTLLGNLENRDLTRKAYRILMDLQNNNSHSNLGDIDSSKREFGKMIYRHHQILSEKIGVSTAKIDKIIETSIEHGAYGAKINGSGFGGTLIIYCPNNRAELLNTLKSKNYEAYEIEIVSNFTNISKDK
ncbi:MAG: mevalonate kinase family protein [Promethearchaeota archaeon]